MTSDYSINSLKVLENLQIDDSYVSMPSEGLIY